MEENKQILLPSKEYAKANDSDLNMPLSLDTSESLMRIGDRDIVLDIDQLYDKERNESVNYKIYGKIRMIFRNLFEGTADYTALEEKLFLVGDGSDYNFNGYVPYDEFAFLRKDVYRQITIPQSGSLTDFNGYTSSTTGYSKHKNISPIEAPYTNWNLYLTYVSGSDATYPMKYTLTGNTQMSFTSGDGIPFRVSFGLVETGATYYELTSPVEHGMNEGEFVTLSGSTLTSTTVSGRTFQIASVGNEVFNSEKYVINILKTQIPSGVTFSTLLTGKRCLDYTNISGTTSQYYVHKHKTLTDSHGYIMDTIGFENPIFEDEKKLLFENSAGVNDVLVERNRMESVLYDFKKPFQLSGITNNFNITPTEVYVTTIFRNGNGLFNYPSKIGYKFNFHDTWIDNVFDGSTSIEKNMTGFTYTFSPNVPESGFETFTGGTGITTGTTLIGDYIEYNPRELKERTISETFHKITQSTGIIDYGQTSSPISFPDGTLFSGASITNPVGLYYKAHHKIMLRQLSPYIEVSKVKDIYNLPENAKYYTDENVWRWRDLYDHGFVDTEGYGTNFPFVNGNHYVKADINFYLRNEMYFTNKQDGVIDFNDKNNNRNKNLLNC